MKKIVIIVNVIIMTAILIFVVLYSRFESEGSYLRQVEHFENITVTMERVTENYMEGEQGICDVWARYINKTSMTMDEAAEYIRYSHVLKNASAHLISVDTLTGLSTRPKQGTADDYAVSYERLDLLKNVDWINEIGQSINVSRAYTNPMNGEQSLAFCNKVTLKDKGSGSSGTSRTGFLKSSYQWRSAMPGTLLSASAFRRLPDFVPGRSAASGRKTALSERGSLLQR